MNLELTKNTKPQGRGWPFKCKVSNSVYNQLLGGKFANVSAFNYLAGKQTTQRSCNTTGYIRGRWR
jgi:hypothetical protein